MFPRAGPAGDLPVLRGPLRAPLRRRAAVRGAHAVRGRRRRAAGRRRPGTHTVMSHPFICKHFATQRTITHFFILKYNRSIAKYNV